MDLVFVDNQAKENSGVKYLLISLRYLLPLLLEDHVARLVEKSKLFHDLSEFKQGKKYAKDTLQANKKNISHEKNSGKTLG